MAAPRRPWPASDWPREQLREHGCLNQISRKQDIARQADVGRLVLSVAVLARVLGRGPFSII